MKDQSVLSAKIGIYQPQDGSGPARLEPFIGEPFLFVKTRSPRWARYVGKDHQLSLLSFRTPDGPVLVFRLRHHDCFYLVACDFGDPEVCRLLDSWRESGGLQIQMVMGKKLVRAIEPARNLAFDEFDRLRDEVKHHDPLNFVRSSIFLREAGLLEQYAMHEANEGPLRIEKQHLTIEVGMLSTEKLTDATIEYFAQFRPDVLDAARQPMTRS
ncbi:hypothetical protein WN982_40800 [Paraburkholderia sp. IMGN_8]|uniref:hypothetical protein n=1 Tax=Paraburkholderia sp. IMGN_8 TaxID=3136564 RepID=UPI003101490C